MLYSFFTSYDALLSLAKYIYYFFFSIVRTSGYRKTDFIRIHSDVHGNISGIVERKQALPLFPRISNVSRYVFLHVFSFSRVYTYVYTFTRTFTRTYVHTYVIIHSYYSYYTYIYYKGREKKYIIKYVNIFLFLL